MDILKMKKESIRRLKAMGVNQKLIDELQKDFKVKVTHLLTGNVGDMTELHQEFLDKFNALGYGFPYYIIEDFTNGQYLISILYVEKDEEEWEFEFSCIESRYPHAYVYNFALPEYNEIGTILIKIDNGILYKVG